MLQQVIGASELNAISCEMLGVDPATHPDINTVAQYAALIQGTKYGAVAIQCVDNLGNPMSNMPFVLNNSVHTTNENGVFIHKAASGSFSASFENCLGYSFNPSTISTTLSAGQVKIYQIVVSEDTSKNVYEFDTSKNIIFAPNVQSVDIVLIGGGAGGNGGGGGGCGSYGTSHGNFHAGNGGNGGRGGTAGNAGSVVRHNNITVTSGKQYSLTVGSGGRGGNGGDGAIADKASNNWDGGVNDGSNGSNGTTGGTTRAFNYTANGGTRKASTIIPPKENPSGYYSNNEGGGGTVDGYTAGSGQPSNYDNQYRNKGGNASGGGQCGYTTSSIKIFSTGITSVSQRNGRDGGHGAGGASGIASSDGSWFTGSYQSEGGNSSPTTLGKVANGTYGGGGSGGNGGAGGRGGNGNDSGSGWETTDRNKIAGTDGKDGDNGGTGGKGAIFVKLNYKSA